MKLVLYSDPDNGVLSKIENKVFPKNTRIVFGYMPADGKNPKPQYTEFWQDKAQKHNSEFVYIDNTKAPNKSQLAEIMGITSLTIAGGNVFALLSNLRKNGYDAIIHKLTKKNGFVYSGFSAGAIIVTPDIRIAGKEHGWSFGGDENEVKIKDTRALGLIDFEILPHYSRAKDRKKLEDYQNKFDVKVKTLGNKEHIILER